MKMSNISPLLLLEQRTYHYYSKAAGRFASVYYTYVFYWPRSSCHHGTEALTYSWSSALPIGQIVTIPMQHLNVPGVVVARVSKPISFAAKPPTAALIYPRCPPPVLQLAPLAAAVLSCPA